MNLELDSKTTIKPVDIKKDETDVCQEEDKSQKVPDLLLILLRWCILFLILLLLEVDNETNSEFDMER